MLNTLYTDCPSPVPYILKRGNLNVCPKALRITQTHKHTHTHTHTHTFNAPLSGTTQVSRYQKGKTNLDFTEETVIGSSISWAICCTSLQTDNHASTPPLSFLQAGCPSCRPTNSIKALKALRITLQKLSSSSTDHSTTKTQLLSGCKWPRQYRYRIKRNRLPRFKQNGATDPRSPDVGLDLCQRVDLWHGVGVNVAWQQRPEALSTATATHSQPCRGVRREKGKGSAYSITERRVPELILVLGSHPDVSHEWIWR